MKSFPFVLAAAVASRALLGVLEVPLQAAPPISQPIEEIPSLKGPPNLPELPLKRKQGTIGTLVRVQSESGAGHSGSLVRISASVLPGTPGLPAVLGYDKFLGPLTMKSLDAVLQPITALHRGWPKGARVQLSYSARPSPAELLPATAAEVLLFDSLLRDWDIEPNLAVVGSIQPDGSFESVGGIPERLLAAGQARVGRLIVPEKNATQVADFLLSQGIAAFVGTQIFTAKNFNEAGMLSASSLEPGVASAVALFGSVQRTLLGTGANAVPLLRSERVQGTLQQVLAGAPNHLSARVLYDWGTGQRSQMSFDGSVEAIDRSAPELIRALNAPTPESLKASRQGITAGVAGLKYMRDRLEPRARGYADALLKFSEAWERAVGTASTPPKKLAGAVSEAFEDARQKGSAEWSKMAQARMEGAGAATKP